MRRLLILTTLLAACTGHGEVEVSAEVATEAPKAETKRSRNKRKTRKKREKIRVQKPDPSLDDRSAYDLAAALTKVLAEPSLTRAQSLETLRTDWQGKRYRWEVGVSLPLCTRADACNVFPFDHASQDSRIVHGWLPHLKMTDATYADLRERCGAGLCVATFEATLSSFVLSPEEPTSLTFSDVEILEVRPREENESWVRRRADPRVAKLRTTNAGR